jgi:hypothetical protein
MVTVSPVVLWFSPEGGGTTVRVRSYVDGNAELEQSVIVAATCVTHDDALAAVAPKLDAAIRAHFPGTVDAIAPAVWCEHPNGADLTADIADILEAEKTGAFDGAEPESN